MLPRRGSFSHGEAPWAGRGDDEAGVHAIDDLACRCEYAWWISDFLPELSGDQPSDKAGRTDTPKISTDRDNSVAPRLLEEVAPVPLPS